MQDRIFIDSNVLIYSLIPFIDENKNKLSKELLRSIHKNIKPIISIQVINETINTMTKYKIENNIIKEIVNEIFDAFDVILINNQIIKIALELKDKFNYSYYDLLIIASAIFAKCNILYSNDLQHNQLIDFQLCIVNPFII